MPEISINRVSGDFEEETSTRKNTLISDLDNTMMRDMKSFGTKKESKNRASRIVSRIVEEKTQDNRGWFTRAMDKVAGVDYQGY